MSRILSILVIGTVVTFAAACSNPTQPGTGGGDDFELPQPDLSLDPGRLSVGEYIATPCAFAIGGGIWGGRLDHLRGRNEWALVDVYFGRATAEGPWDGPTETDIELVTAHGGWVLYRFNVPAVRARIILSKIPDLVEEGYWITVRDVPDATRYDVPSLSVGFTRPLSDSDVDLYVSLGGRVDYRWDFINALSGVLPDRSIPVLRSQPDVTYIQAGGVACLA